MIDNEGLLDMMWDAYLLSAEYMDALIALGADPEGADVALAMADRDERYREFFDAFIKYDGG
jgi:hypothetical protein